MTFIVLCDRLWFKHNHPYEIKIQGWSLHLMFASINDFSVDVVNTIIRMFHKMDDDIYAMYKEKRFRHFLPPQFAVCTSIDLYISLKLLFEEVGNEKNEFQDMVINGTRSVDLNDVAEMFIADHIDYAIGECKLVSDPKQTQQH